MNNGLDYTTNYAFDLAGNRLKKAVDQESDSDIDEETTYLYDAADRLLEENQEIGPTIGARPARGGRMATLPTKRARR